MTSPNLFDFLHALLSFSSAFLVISCPRLLPRTMSPFNLWLMPHVSPGMSSQSLSKNFKALKSSTYLKLQTALNMDPSQSISEKIGLEQDRKSTERQPSSEVLPGLDRAHLPYSSRLEDPEKLCEKASTDGSTINRQASIPQEHLNAAYKWEDRPDKEVDREGLLKILVWTIPRVRPFETNSSLLASSRFHKSFRSAGIQRIHPTCFHSRLTSRTAFPLLDGQTMSQFSASSDKHARASLPA